MRAQWSVSPEWACERRCCVAARLSPLSAGRGSNQPPAPPHPLPWRPTPSTDDSLGAPKHSPPRALAGCAAEDIVFPSRRRIFAPMMQMPPPALSPTTPIEMSVLRFLSWEFTCFNKLMNLMTYLDFKHSFLIQGSGLVKICLNFRFWVNSRNCNGKKSTECDMERFRRIRILN